MDIREIYIYTCARHLRRKVVLPCFSKWRLSPRAHARGLYPALGGQSNTCCVPCVFSVGFVVFWHCLLAENGINFLFFLVRCNKCKSCSSCGRQHDFPCLEGVFPSLFWYKPFAVILIPFLLGLFASFWCGCGSWGAHRPAPCALPWGSVWLFGLSRPVRCFLCAISWHFGASL